MKYSLLLVALLSSSSIFAANDTTKKVTMAPAVSNITVVCPTGSCDKPTEVVAEKACPSPEAHKHKAVTPKAEVEEEVLMEDANIRISVTGQGVAPMNTSSPAQAYALAKRAATADAYRLIAEKVKGVRIDGEDTIQNMMVKRSTVRTSVRAMVRNANVVETTFKEGLCEVEMEITLTHSQFAQ